MLNSFHTTALALLVLVATSAAQQSVKLAKDGFPTGNNTPEGVACDHMRSLIARDSKSKPSRGTPIAIGQCFAARHITKSDPSSFASTHLRFEDIMFVDVQIEQYGGKTNVERTLVIKDGKGKWKIHPDDLSLVVRLNDEVSSEKDFSEAYSTK